MELNPQESPASDSTQDTSLRRSPPVDKLALPRVTSFMKFIPLLALPDARGSGLHRRQMLIVIEAAPASK